MSNFPKVEVLLKIRLPYISRFLIFRTFLYWRINTYLGNSKIVKHVQYNQMYYVIIKVKYYACVRLFKINQIRIHYTSVRRIY